MPQIGAIGAQKALSHRHIVFGTSLGTLFEWYNFYLYGSLASIIGARFFGEFPEETRIVFVLLGFAAGFVVRPFGALVFGRLGDVAGRKYTFLVTILLMGGATVMIGLLPTTETIGIAAPIALIALRLVQGFALGGEYGGAATYIAENAPPERRGLYTGCLQVTASGGLLLSLVVDLATRAALGEAEFALWGWRIPFLLASVLLLVSLWIRIRFEETPVFERLRRSGGRSQRPLKEAFGTWRYGRLSVLALFGLVAGQAVIWYSGQFYVLFFLGGVLKVDPVTVHMLVVGALLVAAPGFVFFGWLSDKVGRKPVILGGCVLAALSYFPVFYALSAMANPELHAAQRMVDVRLLADPAECSFQFNPLGIARFTSGCDVARAALAKASVAYGIDFEAGAAARVSVGGVDRIAAAAPDFPARLATALGQAGYPAHASAGAIRIAGPADLLDARTGMVLFLLTFLVLLVAMVYGPIAAALTELYPTRIRCSGMSLPYHIGNGWFGGLLPAAAFAISAEVGDPYAGLWYPVVVAIGTAAIGALLLPETRGLDFDAADAASLETEK